MPLYVTSLRKSWDIPGITRRKWSNTFYVNAPSAAAAAAALVTAWNTTLRAAATDRVFAYEVYATDLVEGTTDYALQAIAPGSQRGQIPYQTSAEPYDPIVCASVTIPVPGSRPSRKYWRPGLNETDVIGGQALAPALVEAIRTAFNDLIGEFDAIWYDVDGQEWQTPVTVRYTRRRLGRESAENLPSPPPFG